MRSLKDKTLFISGASRGIGKAIALKAAADGANIVIAAKTTEEHPKLPGTIFSAAEEIVAAGGKALPLAVDIREPEQIAAAVEKAVEVFGGIDILVNNASAINLTGTLETPAKRYDLMMDVNVRGSFLCSQACLPHLKKAENPHILMMSPPISLEPRWFGPHLAYTMSKYGMSMCVLGLAEEFRDAGVAVNALWPKSVVATAALAMLGDAVKTDFCRRPDIVADAAYALLTRPSRSTTGRFWLDEEILAEEGVTDFAGYAVAPGHPLLPDLFLG
ncbi:NAD(P)-dependent oxidoreductase [Telmatospirillum sp.]|uniref:SDR family oxidoreductase n=1 Tax=Telmatospirillum sp. TaxID=2079197 RepID=UPI00284ECDCF|nr:NAD(P)-dependent oxidoreductase [Telmatospirillum sp.]MDR3436140.1 NAD(P)-dependent oxidoreductase [Telmatospirillum sp.]